MTRLTPIEVGTDREPAGPAGGGQCREQRHAAASRTAGYATSRWSLPENQNNGLPQRCWSRKRSGALFSEDTAPKAKVGAVRAKRGYRGGFMLPSQRIRVDCDIDAVEGAVRLGGWMLAAMEHRRSCMPRSCTLQDRAKQDPRISGEAHSTGCSGL
jgi:hypothetical protein